METRLTGSTPAPTPTSTVKNFWYTSGHSRGMLAKSGHGGLYTDAEARLQCQAILGHDAVAPDESDWFRGCVAGMTGN